MLEDRTLLSGPNLIINGDFEAGNSGFTTQYTYSHGDIGPAGSYDVVDNPAHSRPHDINPVSYGDHTTGHGLMFAGNGASTANVVVWSETVSIAPNSNYVFSLWMSSWFASSPATFDIQFNGASIGTPAAPSTVAIWQQFSTTWNSGSSTSLTIKIIDTNLADVGSDFALDDISLSAVAPGQLKFSSASYNVSEAAGPATITVTRTGGSDGMVTVHYATSDGTATKGTDYTTTPGDLTFAPGVTSQTFSVSLIDDGGGENDQTVNLTLSNPGGGASLGSSNAVLTITETNFGQLQFNAAAYSIAKSGGSATITVARTGGSDGAITVQYATSDGTAKAPGKYTATSSTLSFGAGDTSKSFTVVIIDNSRPDGDKTINLTLSGPTGSAVLGSVSTAVVTITDDNQGLTGEQSFVRGLYIDFLGRPGSIPELNGWVAQLLLIAQGGVVNGVMRSREAFVYLVNNLYLEFLARPATNDPGSAAWVDSLATGATLEQVSAAILSSAEFADRANRLIGRPNPDENFIRSLYQFLLNRVPGNSEVAGWLIALPTEGRSGVSREFLGSVEFRREAIRTFYGDPTVSPLPFEPFLPNLLRRTTPPSLGEVDGWVDSGSDLLLIENGFASSAEFFANG